MTLETRVFSHDPETGKTVYFHYDETDDSFTLETHEPMGDLVEDAKRAFNEVDERAGWRGDMHHVGWIPGTIHAKIVRENPDPVDYQRAIKRWLNDPDNRGFRSRPGRI